MGNVGPSPDGGNEGALAVAVHNHNVFAMPHARPIRYCRRHAFQ